MFGIFRAQAPPRFVFVFVPSMAADLTAAGLEESSSDLDAAASELGACLGVALQPQVAAVVMAEASSCSSPPSLPTKRLLRHSVLSVPEVFCAGACVPPPDYDEQIAAVAVGTQPALAYVGTLGPGSLLWYHGIHLVILLA